MSLWLIPLVALFGASTAWGQATVKGTIRYKDKVYNSNGFTGSQPWLAVRQADVEVIRASNGALLGSGSTDDGGVINGGAGITGIAVGETVFLRIYARATQATLKVVVKDTNTSAVFTSASGNITTVGGDNTINRDIEISGDIAPAFNILDMGVSSYKYLATLPGGVPSPTPTLTFFWAFGSSNGTYYSKTQDAVFLLGKTTDTDEYDDDVILHEVGHFMADQFSKDDSPGGSHTIIDQKDIRLAWSEGWAHYWSSTVRRFAGYSSPWEFVDTFGSGVSFFEIETPSLGSQTIMATNEVAVAAGLWDMTDTNVDFAGDTLSGNESALWQAMLDVKTRAQVSLEDFRAVIASGLVAASFNDTTPDSIFKNRKVRYYADTSEPNSGPPYTTLTFSGSPPTAGVTVRTIFGAGDEDWYEVALSAGTVQAETRNLGDGCDTVLEIYDTSGTLLGSNDDRAPQGDKSSLVNLQISTPGTYRIRVKAFSGEGAIVEHGYYDLLVDNLANALPTISSFSPSTAGNEAPFRVTFAASATDPDGLIHLYEWDFDGDGKYDFASTSGAAVTRTYDRAGTFLTALRVTDNKGGLSYRTSTVTVTSSSPLIAVTPIVGGTTAPATVTYSIDVAGTVPVSYEWDFEGDGIVDAASTSSNSATAVYREGTAVIAVVYVIDRDGRRFRAPSPGFTIQPGAGAPTVSFDPATTTSSVTIPGSASLNVIATGSPTKYEWDFEGDGRYDQQTTLNQAEYRYLRAGRFTPRVRVTNAAGLTATATTSLEATHTTTAGWLLEPRRNDHIAGNSVALTAEAVPAGQSKKVRFQYRTDNPMGPWIDIGSPITSTGTRFSTVWNVTGIVAGSVFDLRILIDDAISSGDDGNEVTVNPFSFHISESGSVKDRVLRADRSTFTRTAAGVEVFVPFGAMTSSSDVTMRIEAATAPESNGTALGLTRTTTAARLSGSVSFRNAFLLRLPVPAGVDASTLEVHRYDEQARVWRRDFASTVRHDEGTVEVPATTVGLFALFSRAAAAGDGGGGSCFASVPHDRLDLVPLLLLALLWLFSSRSRT